MAEKSLAKHKTVYSLGPIIHNPQVVSEFSKKGLKIIKNINKLKAGSAALLPSHGIDPYILRNRKMPFIDTTCPLVEKVRELVRDLRKKGYFIVIVGDRKHPEVKGLVGIAGKNFCAVVKDKKEARSLAASPKKMALISQTTALLSRFKDVVREMAKGDFAELSSFNTVCKNTIARQAEAKRIAGRVEAMLVIGGKQSANTAKLAGVCRKINKNTYRIESEKDLKEHLLKGKRKIGIATGASTPPYAIREVIGKIKKGVIVNGKW